MKVSTKKADQITVGDRVKHSDHFYTVLDVREENGVVCCIIQTGGRISYMADSVVQFY